MSDDSVNIVQAILLVSTVIIAVAGIIFLEEMEEDKYCGEEASGHAFMWNVTDCWKVVCTESFTQKNGYSRSCENYHWLSEVD